MTDKGFSFVLPQTFEREKISVRHVEHIQEIFINSLLYIGAELGMRTRPLAPDRVFSRQLIPCFDKRGVSRRALL